jgi:hypothetical protein
MEQVLPNPFFRRKYNPFLAEGIPKFSSFIFQLPLKSNLWKAKDWVSGTRKIEGHIKLAIKQDKPKGKASRLSQINVQ